MLENPTTWLVEVDAVIRGGGDMPAGEELHQTLICQSYDGTAAGAKSWAADVLDYCDVFVRSARPVYGELVESRSEGRLDEPSALTRELVADRAAGPDPLEAVEVGQRWQLKLPVDRFPHFAVRSGEAGTVRDLSGGVVCLRMDAPIPGAEEWDNEIVFESIAELREYAERVRGVR